MVEDILKLIAKRHIDPHAVETNTVLTSCEQQGTSVTGRRHQRHSQHLVFVPVGVPKFFPFFFIFSCYIVVRLSL